MDKKEMKQATREAEKRARLIEKQRAIEEKQERKEAKKAEKLRKKEEKKRLKEERKTEKKGILPAKEQSESTPEQVVEVEEKEAKTVSLPEERPIEPTEAVEETEEKPAPNPAKKPRSESKTTLKTAPKKESEKKDAGAPKAAKPAAEKRAEAETEQDDDKKKPNVKNYHISQRADGRWQVKGALAEKALKIFATQAEAIDYAKKVADNQEGNFTIHKKDGKIRKKTY